MLPRQAGRVGQLCRIECESNILLLLVSLLPAKRQVVTTSNATQPCHLICPHLTACHLLQHTALVHSMNA